MKPKFINFYMTVAQHCASMSTAKRLQVGSVVVKDNNIISFSWNGTPAGWDNNCEDKDWMESDAGMWLDPEDIEERWPFREYRPDLDRQMRYGLKTKPEVLHAERNALDKLARGHQSGLGATMFVTHTPCMECAKSIYGAGISEVYYQHEYRSTSGVEFLKQCGIPVIQVNQSHQE
jgi:dCMP deaminase